MCQWYGIIGRYLLQWTRVQSPQKKFGRRLYKFLCLKLRGQWTKSHQIYTMCTEMIANYSAEIKIAIFQSVWKRERDEWRSSSNCGRIAANIARFNSVNSEIYWTEVHQIWTRYCHWTSWKRIYDQPIRCRMSKLRVKVIPRDVCEHLPYLTGCHSNVPWATVKRTLG